RTRRGLASPANAGGCRRSPRCNGDFYSNRLRLRGGVSTGGGGRCSNRLGRGGGVGRGRGRRRRGGHGRGRRDGAVGGTGEGGALQDPRAAGGGGGARAEAAATGRARPGPALRGRGAHRVGGSRVADAHHVFLRGVVGQDRPLPVLGLTQVPAGLAQQAGGGHGGVVDLVGIGAAVAVGVATVLAPRLGDELHRPYSPVELGIPVALSPVGVRDLGEARRPVQLHTDDRRQRVPVLVQRGPVVPTVPRLHVPDPGERGPRQIALGPRLPHGLGGVAVGRERRVRDVHLLIEPLGPLEQLLRGPPGRRQVDRGHGCARRGWAAGRDRGRRLACGLAGARRR